MESIKPHEGAINIFSTHGSVIDPLMRIKLHTEQSPREIVIPDLLLNDKGWNYTILGHIHERGWIGSKDKKTDTSKTNVFYCGSTIRRGFSDKETPLGRGWTLWDIEPNGTFTPQFFEIWQRPQSDFKPIDAANLNSKEITDLIIRNLKKSSGFGEGFNNVEAPILRQRIINLAPSKHQSLDWKAISNHSTHAMQWALKSTSAEEVASETEQSRGTSAETADIVKVYEDWVKNSEAISRVSQDQREAVENQGKSWIESGRDKVLEDA